MKMRVYVAPCGIGLGHVTRAAPIAEELDRRGHQTVFSTYTDGLDYARRKHLPTYEAIPIRFRVTNDGTIDFKRTAATSGFSLGIRMLLRQIVLEIKYMKTFRPDVVLSDSRASSLLAARLLRIPVVLMLNQFRVEIIRRPSARKVTLFDRLFFIIANLGWLFIRTAIEIVWGQSQIILIPDLPPPYTICSGNLAIPKEYRNKVKLIGPIVHFQRPLTDHGNRFGSKSKKPLIYGAVSGPKVERTILARVLQETLRDLTSQYDLVLSCGDPNGRSEPYTVQGLTVYDWIENQDDFIKAADLVISRAGHGTIMRSMMLGKPMILIPIPDHTEQYGNARRAVALHVAQMIDQHDVSKETLDSMIQTILDSNKYHRNALEIRRLAQSSNAINVACDAILTMKTN